MKVARPTALVWAALVLLIIAFLIAADAINGNFAVFLAAGLACDTGSRIP